MGKGMSCQTTHTCDQPLDTDPASKALASMPYVYHLDDPGANPDDPKLLETMLPPNPNRGLKDDEIPNDTEVIVREVFIEGQEGHKVPVRSYSPVFAHEQVFPVMTWSHHGGWRVGNLRTDDSVCRYIAVHAKIVVVNIGYRLFPQYQFPAALNDVYDTVKWVRPRTSFLVESVLTRRTDLPKLCHHSC
jgi:acetyl esterase/lipase